MKTKFLDGRELVGFMKERQRLEVLRLKSKGVKLKLLIVKNGDNPVIEKYVSLKQRYGEDIGIEVEAATTAKNATKEELVQIVRGASLDKSVTGIIVQLPLVRREWEEEVLAEIAPEKDVDGLNGGDFTSATATAIDWLLAGYGVDLDGVRIGVVGYGKLVGRPLVEMWRKRGLEVEVFEKGSCLQKLEKCGIIVSATGVPGLIKTEMVGRGVVIVDAGTASENGIILGDVDEKVRERTDLAAITPKIGGVGPMTVGVLFEWVIRAGR